MWQKKIINTLVFTSSIINILKLAHKFLLFGDEEKLVALLVYTSSVRVATSGFRIFPYSLVVVVVFAQMRSDSGIIP